MTRWYEQRMAAFDVETTGPEPTEARIVSACVVHLGGGKESDTHQWIVNPGVDIPAEASAIHGITTERVREHGQAAAVAVPEIAKAVWEAMQAGALVIFNAPYDLTVLDCEVRRLGFDRFAVLPVIVDPFVIDKRIDRYRKGKRTLAAACAHYGVKLDGAHDATHDAIAAARLAYRLASVWPQIGDCALTDLHAAQAEWYSAEAARLEEYFRRTKPDAVCNREWPIRTAPVETAPASEAKP